jgi:hypothetical protein
MLRNVISSFTLKVFGALKLISWKYTFKRLNEEYELAKKKKQALDNLFESGKISQSTRDSFTNGINAAIVQIEKQQKELIENMQLKTQELENQIQTLETLLANYEIQHVVGEIDEQIYQQEITLLTTGLETTRNELNVIKQSTIQLCSPPSIQAPVAPEPVAPVVEVVQPAPVEQPPVEVPVEAAPVEIVMETSPVPLAPVESAPAEIPVETVKAEAVPVESAPVEIAPVEAAPIETAPAAIETTPVEVAPVETPIVEIAPVETAPIAPPEPEVQVINEPTPEIAPQEPEVTEPALQEPIINMDAEAPIEQPAVEAETEDIAPTEVMAEAEPEQSEVKVPLQDFEVIPEATPIETTLEKVMEPLIETINAPLIVEESIPQAHPLEAPQAGQTEAEQSSEEAATATETEDSSEEETE